MIFLTNFLYDRTIHTVASKIRKLLYRFLSRLLDYYCKGPPPLIFTCTGFNFIRTSKEKQSHTTTAYKVVTYTERQKSCTTYIFAIFSQIEISFEILKLILTSVYKSLL